MITLHYFPGNASLAPHILLRELGVPFELQLVDRAQGAQKSPAYLKLNPNGQIPVLVDGELVLYETAAILLHLADTHRQAALAPPLGSAERAHFYKWLMWLTNTMQATLMLYFYPERCVDADNVSGARQVKAHAQARVDDCLRQLDDRLAANASNAGPVAPWFAGTSYSALDPFVFLLCRWTRGFEGSAPAREYTHIAPYLQRMLARPAVQQALAAEKLPQPWV